MIATSTVAVYGLTYLSGHDLDHVHFSKTRVHMSLIVGAAMATIMRTFTLHMHRSRAANLRIYLASAALFVAALWLVRSQASVGQVSTMKAMIPHHSIAILTSERAQIDDPRVRDLADRILEAQVAEIAEMKAYIADLEGQ